MKLLTKQIDKNGKGYYKLEPVDDEDMWHAYNLIREGDVIRGKTFRKLTKVSATGSTTSEKKTITLSILVDNVFYEAETQVLRVSGRVCEENKFVKLSAHHTIELAKNRAFAIEKDEWDVIDLERISLACDPARTADVAVIIMREGLAHVCLITSSTTVTRAKIESSIPRKRRGSATKHDKGLERFFEDVLQAVLRHIDFDVVKCIVLASPGFVKDQFYNYMTSEALKRELKTIVENKDKFLKVHSSTGHKGGIREVLADAAVSSAMAETKASGEVRVLQRFYEMMKSEPDRAFYGDSYVFFASSRLAIQDLLITDALFRTTDLVKRKKYIALSESVKECGGELHIFSAAHVSGEQLAKLGGIAAILRFPLPDVEVSETESSEE